MQGDGNFQPEVKHNINAARNTANYSARQLRDGWSGSVGVGFDESYNLTAEDAEGIMIVSNSRFEISNFKFEIQIWNLSLKFLSFLCVLCG